MPDATRATYYAREARKSAETAKACAERGDVRSARAWLYIAESERESCAFWLGDASPDMGYLKPGFML